MAATVRGVAKDLLVGEHIRQHRRTMRLARGAVTLLAALLVLALLAAALALGQRQEALNQARVASARQLAATAVANLDTNLAVSQQLAVEAYRMDPDLQTRSALLRAVTASPRLVRSLPTGALAGPPLATLLGDLAAVDDHGEDICDDEDADAPGEADPDVAADRLPGE